MILLRPAKERGNFNHGWLDTSHTFSFADYYDPEHMGFHALRVINEDRVEPGQGFGTHPHNNMEIITYVLEGALEHKDSMGNGSMIYPGEVQRMSAGTGVTHSEFNPSLSNSVHLLQIWILPRQKGLPPSYEQKIFKMEEKEGRWRLVASESGREGSVTIHQDADLLVSLLKPGEEITYSLKPNRHAWLQLARGKIVLNGKILKAGDGAALSEEPTLSVKATENSEILLFDLAP
jgi:redox-sensitive bicupin YhaK (pirin superfamily)